MKILIVNAQQQRQMGLIKDNRKIIRGQLFGVEKPAFDFFLRGAAFPGKVSEFPLITVPTHLAASLDIW